LEEHSSLIFNLEDGGTVFLWLVGTQPECYMVQHSGRPPFVFILVAMNTSNLARYNKVFTFHSPYKVTVAL
jgi:hypothetical protein